MTLQWLDRDLLLPADVDGIAAAKEAARLLDAPHEPVLLPAQVAAYLQHGWDGEPPAVAVARVDGRVAGVLELGLPERDNRHAASLDVVVDPARRRRGIGRALAEAGTARARSCGRTTVLAYCFDAPAPAAFAAALGLTAASVEAKRRQDLVDIDRAALDVLASEVSARHADYELVRLPATVPEELLDAVVTMVAAINDAPTDDLDVEDEAYDVRRVRDHERAQAAMGRRMYRVAARHRGTGALCGHTSVAVESQQPWYAHQFDTSVVAAHRGHGLGIALKLAMLRWLAEVEPALRVLDTWNAVSNDHMVAVNEALGYRVLATGTAWQRSLA